LEFVCLRGERTNRELIFGLLPTQRLKLSRLPRLKKKPSQTTRKEKSSLCNSLKIAR
jgi:hypothetical protein